jgi:SAM-dependent methyltransferase
MAEPIPIEFTKPNPRRYRETDDSSWVQCLEKPRRLPSRLVKTIRHDLKTLVESTMEVQIFRQRNGDWSKFATEYHHQSYGSPWCGGRDIADYVISRGLQTNHNLLDFGCGSIRAGIWLIAYLDEGHYFGVDAHWPSLDAAVRYEIPLHDLEGKHPRFLHSGTFEIDHFGQRFEMILASRVFNHLTEAQVGLALGKIGSTLAPSGKLVLAPRLPADETTLKNKYGLELIHTENRQSRFNANKSTDWFELMLS